MGRARTGGDARSRSLRETRPGRPRRLVPRRQEARARRSHRHCRSGRHDAVAGHLRRHASRRPRCRCPVAVHGRDRHLGPGAVPERRPGSAARRFLQLGDPELKLVCVEAYNDFQTDWASADSRRLIPSRRRRSGMSTPRSPRCNAAPTSATAASCSPASRSASASRSSATPTGIRCGSAQASRSADQLPHRLGQHRGRLRPGAQVAAYGVRPRPTPPARSSCS